MALFRKNINQDLFLQFPDGTVIDSQEDFDRLMKEFTFTPTSMSNWQLHKSDIKAMADASTKLLMIGLNDEPFFAFGPVKLFRFPKDYNEYIADAVLTPKHLVVYYQKNLLKPDILILPLLNLSGISSLGPWSAEFNFKNAIYMSRKGTYKIADAFLGLSERFGKDGHANRRSITLIKSLGDTLNEINRSL